MGFWLLLLLIILLLLAAPWWPYSRPRGYWPGSVLLVLLIVWIVLLWLGMAVFY
jgi:hypothetical protein